MKKSLVEILSDNEQLNEYISSLEDELEKTEFVDAQLDVVLNNILNLYSNFADRRALRASNINAITEMLKLKSELPMKRIQAKKMILDILSKKKELEIKEKNSEANNQLAGTAVGVLAAVFNRLDQNNIHPEIDDNVLECECRDIIDIPASLSDTNMLADDIVTNVEKIQEELDTEDMEEYNNDNGDDTIA